MLLAIVSLQPGHAGLGREPQGEIDREMRVNAFGLHGVHDFQGVPHLCHVHIAIGIETAAMHADQVHTMLGKHAGTGPELFPLQILRRAIHSPEPHWLAIGGEDELPILDADKAMFAGKCLVERPQVDHTGGRKGIGLGIEREPALVVGQVLRHGRRKLVGLENAVRCE